MTNVKRIDEAPSIRTEALGPSGEHLFVPPQSIEAESSLLGSILLHSPSFDLANDIVSEPDFYRYEHRLIFAAIKELFTKRKAIDVVTVFELCSSRGNADEIGGIQYLHSLAQYVASSKNIVSYAQIVHKKAVLRRMAAAGENIARLPLTQQGAEIDDLLGQAEKELLMVGNAMAFRKETPSINERVVDLLDCLQALSEDPTLGRGVLSGFGALDDMTNGFQGGDLVIIAARPSMGKTALAMNIAADCAFVQKKPVVAISLEMSGRKLTFRLAGSVCSINQSRLAKGQLDESEWSRVTELDARMDGVFDIEDASTMKGLGVSVACSIARRAARKHGKLGMVVVDYIQLLDSDSKDKDNNKNLQISEITRCLKLLAIELNCPVIALSQLNRGVENRPNKRPVMSDLRDSGAIEQDADVIMFIYRDDYYTKEASREPGVAEIDIAKHRNGPTGMVRLAWQPAYARFDNLGA